MGSKGGSTLPEVQTGMLKNSNALTAIAQQQSANSQQLFNTTFPGLSTSENFYSTLSSGDPSAIARAIAPAAQQISAATTGSINNIMNTTPVGGERNLAIDMAKLNQGAQVGSTASNAYLNSFNALAQLAGQGVNQSIGAASTGISGLGSANQGLMGAGQLGIESKGATLGGFGSLLNAGAELGSAAILHGGL